MVNFMTFLFSFEDASVWRNFLLLFEGEANEIHCFTCLNKTN